VLSHLPVTLSIVAAGAAIVSVIGHAHDVRALALLLLLVLGVLWAFAVPRFLRAGAWGDAPEQAEGTDSAAPLAT
jgi:hypothetical protein